MPDYARAQIYAIVDVRTGEHIYLSGTCNQLCCRMGNHRSIVMYGPESHNGMHQPVHLYMRRAGIFNFSILQLEPYPCSGRAALRAREKALVLELGPRFYNAQCMVDTHGNGHEPVRCPCGCTVTRAGLRQHKRTAKHQRRLLAIKKPQGSLSRSSEAARTAPNAAASPLCTPAGTACQTEIASELDGPSGPD